MLRSPDFIASSYNQPTACYTGLSFLGKAPHLAATLKRLLTILLLVILAGQTTGYFHEKADDISFVKEAEDKAEKWGEGKNEKEYVSLTFLNNPGPCVNRSFASYSCKPGLSPLLEHLTPPPDVKL